VARHATSPPCTTTAGLAGTLDAVTSTASIERRGGWLVLLLAAVLALATTALLGAATGAGVASAATVSTASSTSGMSSSAAGTRVGASTTAAALLVGSSAGVCADQGRGDLSSQSYVTSGLCVAAEDGADGAANTTAVIGRQVDTAVAKDWAGHEVLDLPSNEWTLAKNDQWVQSVIDRKMPVYVGSPTTWPNLWDAAAGRSTVFGRELQQFTGAGYTWAGYTLVPPGAG
jgi:hypothetical protein